MKRSARWICSPGRINLKRYFKMTDALMKRGSRISEAGINSDRLRFIIFTTHFGITEGSSHGTAEQHVYLSIKVSTFALNPETRCFYHQFSASCTFCCELLKTGVLAKWGTYHIPHILFVFEFIHRMLTGVYFTLKNYIMHMVYRYSQSQKSKQLPKILSETAILPINLVQVVPKKWVIKIFGEKTLKNYSKHKKFSWIWAVQYLVGWKMLWFMKVGQLNIKFKQNIKLK